MSTKEIHADFVSQALSPEDPNWPVDPHTPYIEAHLSALSRPCLVLDVGSGKSRVSGTLKERLPDFHFTGADFVQESLNVALDKRRLDDAIHINLAEYEGSSPLPESYFDAAFSTRSAFYFSPDELVNMLRHAHHALKPDAYFLCQHFFVTPFHSKAYVSAFRGAKTQYRHLESLDVLQDLHKKTGFEMDMELARRSIFQKANEFFPSILSYSRRV